MAVWEMKPDGRVMVDGHPTGASAELLAAVARAIHDRDCVEIVACKTPARRYYDLASAVLAVPAVAELVEMNALLSEEVQILDGLGARDDSEEQR